MAGVGKRPAGQNEVGGGDYRVATYKVLVAPCLHYRAHTLLYG
jgi:hypothetical protein